MKKYSTERGRGRVVKAYMVVPDLNEALVEYAKAQRVTVASCVEEAFTEYLERRLMKDKKA